MKEFFRYSEYRRGSRRYWEYPSISGMPRSNERTQHNGYFASRQQSGRRSDQSPVHLPRKENWQCSWLQQNAAVSQ